MTIPTTIYTANWLTRLSACFVFSLLFTACQLDDPNGIGQGLNSLTNSIGVNYAEFDLTSATVLVDSVPATNSAILIGYANDPLLGKITARNFTQFLYSQREDLGSSPQFDSTKLILYTRRDSTQNQAITQPLTIHRLTGSIDASKIYYTKDQIAFEATDIGNKYVYTRAASVSDGVDSLKIKLDGNVGQTILSAYVNTLTTSDFLTQFKGLAIQSNQSQNLLHSYGQTVSFNGSTYYTRIEVYYHNPGSSIGKKFALYPSSGGGFNQVTFEGAGALSSLKNTYDAVPSTSTNQTSYILSSIGLRTKITLPSLEKLRDTSNILINDARLIVSPLSSTVLSNVTNPPNQLVLYELNPSGKIYRSSYTSGTNTLYYHLPLTLQLTSGFASRQPSGKYVGEYVFDVTGYMQQLLYNNTLPENQRRPNTGLLLSAPSEIRNASTGQVSYFGENELTLRGIGIGNAQHPSNPMKLIVYYTYIN